MKRKVYGGGNRFYSVNPNPPERSSMGLDTGQRRVCIHKNKDGKYEALANDLDSEADSTVKLFDSKEEADQFAMNYCE